MKQTGTTRAPLPLCCSEDGRGSVRVSLNLKELMRLRAAIIQHSTASLKFNAIQVSNSVGLIPPIAWICTFGSVQSATSSTCNQGISNGSSFAVYSALSFSP